MLRKSLWQHVRSAGGRLLRKLHVRESTIQTIKAAVTAPPPPLYPLDIPAIAIQPGLDFLLLELPPRYQPMMPNGIGYVHNVLLKTGVRFQTVDANVLMYHRYHQSRILGGVPLVTPGGYAMKDDPWDNTNTAEWEREDVSGLLLAGNRGPLAADRPQRRQGRGDLGPRQQPRAGEAVCAGASCPGPRGGGGRGGL